MIVSTFLMGGCANQMFQYAAGLCLSQHFGAELWLNNSRFFEDREWRVYSLGLFKGVTERTVQHMIGKEIPENGLRFDPNKWPQSRMDCTLVGYWQSEKWFAHLKGDLQNRFVPKDPLPEHHQREERLILGQGNSSVFVTIRRTDYVGNSFHGVLPMEYYREAAEIIAAKVPNPTFHVFSDDPEWCEANFRLPYWYRVCGNYDRTVKPHLGREDAELWLMRQCRHAILANSSYSWWGAWLGRADEGGIVVAPKAWFGPNSGADAGDIVPDRWIKI